MAAGLHPLVRGVFGFDEANSILLTWTARVYLLTLAGYAVQETLVRAFYARQEPWPPVWSVLIRLVIYLGIGVTAIVFFPNIGAPAIALAEIAATVEAVFLFVWLNKRLPERAAIGGSMLRGLLASLIGAAAAYSLAVMLPGGAILTALVGVTVGGLIVLPIIWKEVRLLFNL
jgi:peptidoglycan biosynthesis protein MviN/MurJ (putative lipid II flippase)